jgi:nucleoside 2-deoxyribosyltransferase
MDSLMKIYCAGAIRGELYYKEYFDRIIEIVKDFGEPLTEKVAYDLYPVTQYGNIGEQNAREKLVAERDRQMIGQCRAVIAEVSGASTGTGWEICYATRLNRKPTLCLYDVRSFPSLIIKQDNSPYTIVQDYTDKSKFETYVRCFLGIVRELDNIDDIKRIYLKARRIAELSPSGNEVERLIESLIAQSPEKTTINPKDANEFVEFLFRNLVLQTRWDRLKSQEIGSTYVGGRKSAIIKTLSSLEDPTDAVEIYKREGEYKIKYTREAFTKNLRAFRAIGLVQSFKTRSHYANEGPRFKDKVALVRTLSGNIKMVSSSSRKQKTRNLFLVTNHLRQLAWFLGKFGSASLKDILKQSRKMKIYSEMPGISPLNIDEIRLDKFLEHSWAQELVMSLQSECKRFWEQKYSSFIPQ